ncbi:MAG TPA: NAD-dependent epimerase/dehydratase family protein [Planctomycetaceae bacterium]|nr:NAD-dependent epimerase/dehydratase family protein [Planctomycetaceae bacterium]
MNDLLLITGATGLVGSHVAERAREIGLRTRALIRGASDTRFLDRLGVEKVDGELVDPESLRKAVAGVTLVIHCAAKVGDWGPVDDYRAVNVRGLEHLLNAAEASGTLRRFIHISSLGVYEGRDHHGTDESVEPSTAGMDGYTLTKVEAEQLVVRHIRDKKLPGTILRPGFIYGPRDRTVLPRLLERLKAGQVKYLGTGEQLMNNTFVLNLVDVIFDVLERPETIGQIYNITDGALVSKRDFISTVATLAGFEVPRAAVPLGVARFLTTVSEKVYRWLGKKEAPLLSNARFKFLGLNLDFSIEKARRELGYKPRFTFQEGMTQTINWFREERKL